MSFAVSTCATSPRWLRVSLRMVTMPRSGRERDGVTSRTSLSTVRTSPGRVGFGQEISAPAPMTPPAKGAASPTSNFMVMAATCQPLAASPPKKVSFAASSSRWKGCGSNSLREGLDLVGVNHVGRRREALTGRHVVESETACFCIRHDRLPDNVTCILIVTRQNRVGKGGSISNEADEFWKNAMSGRAQP